MDPPNLIEFVSTCNASMLHLFLASYYRWLVSISLPMYDHNRVDLTLVKKLQKYGKFDG